MHFRPVMRLASAPARLSRSYIHTFQVTWVKDKEPTLTAEDMQRSSERGGAPVRRRAHRGATLSPPDLDPLATLRATCCSTTCACQLAAGDPPAPIAARSSAPLACS